MRSFIKIISYKISLLFCLVLFFAACGGGGNNSSSNGQPIIVGPSTTTSIATVTITKPSLQFSETTTVSATFKKADGSAANGVSVNFTTTLGTLTPSNGVAITDVNGIATVQLTAGANSGQGQITASATIDNKQVTKSGLFSVSLPTLKLTQLALGLATLSYGGSTSVSVTVTDTSGNPYIAQSVDVVFSSTESALGKAAITSPVRTINGVATSTYKATTVTGTDTITASISGASATANITINPLNAGSITFISASPTNIGLKGMGGAGYTETSIVTFKVVDTSGQPKPNQQVDFVLNTNVGGLSMSQASGSTLPDGTVSTIVQAGTVATPIRVTATVRNSSPVISTQSDQLVISTGVPAQDGFSVSIVTLNSESMNHDGVTIPVTARLSDHFHNPVPNGTAVSFTTSGGAIQPSCITVGGACTVNWISQNPRAAKGRAVILAYAIGEEGFIDLNGNGVADTGEFTDTTEAFRDDNYSGVRDLNETFIDFNLDGAFNGPDGFYNGILRPSSVPSTVPKSKNVFSNSQIVMSTDAAFITTNPATITGPGQFDVTVTDLNGNTMAAGTTFTITVPFGTVSGMTSFTVPQNTGFGQTLPVFVAAAATPKSQSGLITIAVKSPGGLTTTAFVSISGLF